jgi:hypothetical protein
MEAALESLLTKWDRSVLHSYLIRVVPREFPLVPYWDEGFFLFRFLRTRRKKIMSNLKQCILELLEQNSRLPIEEMACLLMWTSGCVRRMDM